VKSIGLVGLPYSGKSTLFTALTHSGSAGGRANQAVVTVPDPRVEELQRLEGSGKAVHAQVRFVDEPGGTSSAHSLAELREADALCVVLRAFGPDADAARDWAEVRADLILADLAVVESALEGARKRARVSKDASAEAEAQERAQEALGSETLLRDAGFDATQIDSLRGLGLFTLKPWVPVANLEEGSELPADLPEGTVPVWAELEAETAEMTDSEAREILAEFGVTEPGLLRVIRACYRALDLVTFLTANDREAHAWQAPDGATATEAAGVIHSDMQRGFIRAEVIGFDDLVSAGGRHPAKERGLVRVEGKDYVVREGDVLQIRFAV
jgi:ribosome-binding ATPase